MKFIFSIKCLSLFLFLPSLLLSVILSVFSKTSIVRSRLGESVLLDCGYWVDPSSPLHDSGFAVEWRYQFRGEGKLVVAYDGLNDRFADMSGTDAELDLTALYETRNASLLLKEARVSHVGTFICTIYLPHLLAQVALELEVVGEEHFSHLTVVLFPDCLHVTCIYEFEKLYF